MFSAEIMFFLACNMAVTKMKFTVWKRKEVGFSQGTCPTVLRNLNTPYISLLLNLRIFSVKKII